MPKGKGYKKKKVKKKSTFQRGVTAQLRREAKGVKIIKKARKKNN